MEIKRLFVVLSILPFTLSCTYTVREYAHGNDNCTFLLKSSTRVAYKGRDREINMHPAAPTGGPSMFMKLLGMASYPLGQWAGKPEYDGILDP